MPLNTTWGTEARTRDPLHLTSAPRPMVLDANRITDSHRDFVCDDPTKTGVFNLDCGAPPPPPPTAGPSSLASSVRSPVVGPGSIAASVRSPVAGPSAMTASVAAPVSGPSSLTATAPKPEFNISPYLGNSYDTEAEILALQSTAPDGLVAYNESTHTLYIWVAAQALWHKFVWEFNIAPLEVSQSNFVNSAPVGNDNIKFAEDVDHLFINDGTDWHKFKEE